MTDVRIDAGGNFMPLGRSESSRGAGSPNWEPESDGSHHPNSNRIAWRLICEDGEEAGCGAETTWGRSVGAQERKPDSGGSSAGVPGACRTRRCTRTRGGTLGVLPELGTGSDAVLRLTHTHTRPHMHACPHNSCTHPHTGPGTNTCTLTHTDTCTHASGARIPESVS